MKAITKTSTLTGAEYTMVLDITDAELARWQEGEHIHNVFPHLTAGEHEFLMTGVTPEEWDAMFFPENDISDYDEDDRSSEDWWDLR